MNSRAIGLVFTVLAAMAAADSAVPGDPVAPWRGGLRIGPVSPGAQGHTIRSYFNTRPVFSPNGRLIYYNVSSGEWTQLFVAECAAGGDTSEK